MVSKAFRILVTETREVAVMATSLEDAAIIAASAFNNTAIPDHIEDGLVSGKVIQVDLIIRPV